MFKKIHGIMTLRISGVATGDARGRDIPWMNPFPLWKD
jgi:hypothetical protein